MVLYLGQAVGSGMRSVSSSLAGCITDLSP
jgi:hypothetical protein